MPRIQYALHTNHKEKGLVVVASSDGTDQMLLCETEHAYSPLPFSPNSKRVAVPYPEGIYLVSVDGQSKRQISYSKTESFVSDLSFSPDGRRLIFTVSFRSSTGSEIHHADPPDEVRIVDLDNMKESCVASSETFLSHAEFSPSGERILFARKDTRRDKRLYLVNPDGSWLVELLGDALPYGYEETEWQGISVPIGEVSFSPDGRRVILVLAQNQIRPIDVDPLKPVNQSELAARLEELIVRGKMTEEKTDLAWRRAKSISEPTLRSLARSHGMLIGTEVRVEPLRSDALYAEMLAHEFSVLTPGVAMKFKHIHPAKGRYDFDDADTIVDFAEAHDMQVRGHTLVWHRTLPRWLVEENWTRDELMKILRGHIMMVVGRYRGRVIEWDVVNEAVARDGSLMDTFWSTGIGPEYIEMAFRWAHEADPDALLFYNDFGGEGLGQKSDAIYKLVQDLMKRGVPIHGVGLQMHDLGGLPKPQDVAANMERLSRLGLEVRITEMDVIISGPITEEKLSTQASVYCDMLEVAMSAENCKAFMMWGFTDRYSWVPEYFSGRGAALVFDELYLPKPAYNAIVDTLGCP